VDVKAKKDIKFKFNCGANGNLCKSLFVYAQYLKLFIFQVDLIKLFKFVKYYFSIEFKYLWLQPSNSELPVSLGNCFFLLIFARVTSSHGLDDDSTLCLATQRSDRAKAAERNPLSTAKESIKSLISSFRGIPYLTLT